MIQILKPVVSLLMFLIVLFFIGTVLTITVSFPAWLATAISLLSASLAAWFAWKLVCGEKTGAVLAVIGGALILGGLFFTIGFLGPMVVSKDTNQGPMIGLFIAGPLGVIMGAVGGYVYAAREKEGVGGK